MRNRTRSSATERIRHPHPTLEPELKPLIVRNSSRTKFKRCPRAYWWAYEDGLAPRRASDPLVFGTWVHEALAAWYCGPGKKRGPHPADIFSQISDSDLRSVKIESEEKEDKYHSMQDLGVTLLEEYVNFYGRDENMLILKPEKTISFRIPIPGSKVRVQQVGTVDGVYRDGMTGYAWLLEHKTAKTISTSHLSLDEQPSTYLSTAERSLRRKGLLASDERIHGIMYNFLRKGLPDTRPIDDEGYALNKNGSRSKTQPKPLFHRHPIHRTTKARKRFLNRLQQDARRMLDLRAEVAEHGESVIMKTPHWSCTRFCEFFGMCELEENGGNWQTYRDAMYVKRDPFIDHRKSSDEVSSFEFS
ncbi:MAG: PD-(D/E)XK nuclease family protein [Candidatus Binatia bacterium]